MSVLDEEVVAVNKLDASTRLYRVCTDVMHTYTNTRFGVINLKGFFKKCAYMNLVGITPAIRVLLKFPYETYCDRSVYEGIQFRIDPNKVTLIAGNNKLDEFEDEIIQNAVESIVKIIQYDVKDYNRLSEEQLIEYFSTRDPITNQYPIDVRFEPSYFDQSMIRLRAGRYVKEYECA